MKVKLVCDGWEKEGKPVGPSDIRLRLTSGDFHSGTTFDAVIVLDAEQEDELKWAIAQGYRPVFWLSHLSGKKEA